MTRLRIDAPDHAHPFEIAQAIVGDHVLLKGEQLPSAQLWYRDRPMRELSSRIFRLYVRAYTAMLVEMNEYVEREIGAKLTKAEVMIGPVFLTPAQVEALRDVIEKHHAAFAVHVVDPTALPPEALQRLVDEGAITASSARMIEDAYRYGRALGWAETLADKRHIEKLTYAAWRSQPQPPLSPAEANAIDFANHAAAIKIRGLGNRVAEDFTTKAIEADRALRTKFETTIREKLSANIERRETWRQLQSEMGHATEDWSRDLGRIAATEKMDALIDGQARAMRHRTGDDPDEIRVAKQPNPDACADCHAAYLEGGKPRIFTMAELQANGANHGRKRKDWLPTLGPLHPWCFLPGTPVRTEWGEHPIEKISIGTLVVTHTNRLRAVQRLSKRDFRGELIVLTAGGKILKTTPEHPLLTARGWVRAESIEVRDYLLQIHERPSAHVESQDIPAQHGDVTILEAILRALARRGMPVGIDLDDGTKIGEAEIGIEWADRELWNWLVADRMERAQRAGLVWSEHPALLASLSRLHLLPDRARLSAASGVSCLREALSIFRAALGSDEETLLAQRSDPNALLAQTRSDRTPRGVEPLREFFDALTALVRGDDLSDWKIETHAPAYHGAPVTSTTRERYDGPVFNFAVEEDESYIAGGFVAHNCACELIEVPSGWGFDADGNLSPLILKRSDFEWNLRKAETRRQKILTYGDAVGDVGISVRIGDPEIRAIAEEVVARTPVQLFTRATGLTLITTDHGRPQNPLDENDYAYWAGNEIRLQQTISPKKVKRVLEHEIGHSLNTWLVTKFGSIGAVREWHQKLWKISEEEGFVSSYAKNEPIENAAEVSRLYLYYRPLLQTQFPRQFAFCHRAYGELFR